MDMPEYLDKEVRKEWKQAAKVLQDIGLLTELDVVVFSMYCQAYSEWRRAIKEKWDYSPEWYKIMNESYACMMKATKLFGLLPPEARRKG